MTDKEEKIEKEEKTENEETEKKYREEGAGIGRRQLNAKQNTYIFFCYTAWFHSFNQQKTINVSVKIGYQYLYLECKTLVIKSN